MVSHYTLVNYITELALILLVKRSIVICVRHDWLSLHEYYSFMGLGMLLWLPTFLEVANGEASLETASGKGEQVMLLH